MASSTDFRERRNANWLVFFLSLEHKIPNPPATDPAALIFPLPFDEDRSTRDVQLALDL
jgi:hypothetical protein